MGTPRIHLDERDFATDVALGEMTLTEVSAKHGMSRSHAGDIARGRRRPHVRPLIEDLRNDLERECKRAARLRLVRLVKPAVDTFADAMEGNASGTALAAAKELLHRVLGDDWSPNDATVQPPRPAPSLMDLSPETKLQVLKELGGPLEERPDYPGLPAGGDLISADGARVGPFDGGEP